MDHRTTRRLAAIVFPLAAAAGVLAQAVPLAIGPLDQDGPYDIWVLDEADGQLTSGPTELTFLDVTLLGYPRAERLRLDRPASVETEDDDVQHVRLPGGGALYRVSSSAGAALLHVSATGAVSLPLQLDSAATELRSGVHVSTDGCLALATTTHAGGDDVWLLDLAGQLPAACLTDGLAGLAVAPASLRVSQTAAWFVAEGSLYRADLTGDAVANPVELASPGLPVQPELAGAAHDGRIVAVLGETPDARMLVSVSATGEVVQLTPAPTAVQLPGYEHPLGPRLALSPDGAVVAWTQLEGDSLELFTKDTSAAPGTLHVTAEPEFPAYIDNVGVLGFQTERRLLFLTGDTTLSGLDSFDTIGAGEMFLADLTVPGSPVYANVSQTGGGYAPPYLEPATLSLTEAVLDPLAQHCVISGGSGMALASFPLYPPPAGASVVTHLVSAEDEPELQRLGDRLLVSSEPTSAEQPDGSGPEIDLDVGVLSLGDPDSPSLATVLSLPDGIDAERSVTDDDGQWVALAIELDDGAELPVLLHADTGALQLPTWPLLVGLRGPLSFSPSGRLYFSIGAESGPTKFVAVTPGESAQIVSAPKGRGFPLSR